jgi:hypothetical protein
MPYPRLAGLLALAIQVSTPCAGRFDSSKLQVMQTRFMVGIQKPYVVCAQEITNGTVGRLGVSSCGHAAICPQNNMYLVMREAGLKTRCVAG